MANANSEWRQRVIRDSECQRKHTNNCYSIAIGQTIWRRLTPEVEVEVEVPRFICTHCLNNWANIRRAQNFMQFDSMPGRASECDHFESPSSHKGESESIYLFNRVNIATKKSAFELYV